MQIKDKVAIVTGASSGIGLATAKLFSEKGAKVALVARSSAKLNSISKKLPQSFVVVADMRHETEIKEMVSKVYKHYGRIDILINNAGRSYFAPVEKINSAKLHEIFDLNFVGPLRAIQHAVPIMRKQKGGVIVNISSGTSLMNLPNLGAYSSLKRALNGLSLTAHEELLGDKIAVSVVYPYITSTNLHKNAMRSGNIIERGGSDRIPTADPADYVAAKILEAVVSQKAEIFAHDWMKKDS